MIRLPAIPIIYRELLTAARSQQSRRIRLVMGSIAVIGSVLAIVLMDTFSNAGAAGGGKAMLGYVTGAAYLYCIAIGFSLTLTSISEEREQGTLSLLFLTDLRGGEIVIAKLFTRSLRTLEGLIAAMPLVATCILLGGVTPGEYARVAVGLINALFVSATLGMYISAQRLQRTAAAFLGGALALSIGALIPFLVQVLDKGFQMPELGLLVAAFSPWSALQHAPASPIGGISPEYWRTLCSSFTVGLLFLALAIRAVRSNWQDRANEAKKLRRRKDFQNWDFKSSSRDPAYRRKLLELNPICWLNSRDRFRSIGYWIYLGVIYFTMTLCWWFLDRRGTPLPYWWLAAMIFDIGIRTKINQAAGIQLIEERKQGSLEMLLCAPLGLPKILNGFFLALRRQFAPMLLAALGLNLLILLFTLLRHSQMQRRSLPEAGFIILIVACYMIAAASSYRALAWVGMWNGLKNKPGAALSGFGLIQILARPILLIFLTFLALVVYELAGGQIWSKFTVEMFVVYGAVVFLISDQLFVRQARAAIPAAFQFAATGVPHEEPVEDKATPRPKKMTSGLIARLWRRRWIRWATPVLVLALILVGYRWNLRRDYNNRLESLRAGGAPVSLADINADIQERRSPTSSRLMLDVYKMTSNVPIRPGQSPTVERYTDLIRKFEIAVGQDAVDLDVSANTIWPYYVQAGNMSLIVNDRVGHAIYKSQVDDAIKLLNLANRHHELLRDADLIHCQALSATHIHYLISSLGELLSRRDPTREQLLGLQREIERLLGKTPAFMARQVDLLNASQIEEMDQSPLKLLNAAATLGRKPPARSAEKQLQFHTRTLLGAVERERLLRLECARIAREIALHPSAESIAKIKPLQAAAKESLFLRNAVRQLEVYAVASCRDTLNLRVAITALAVERYRMDHNGTRPGTADRLVPLYLKTVPLDPFTNQPLVIYSVSPGHVVTDSSSGLYTYKSSAMRIRRQRMRISR